jgi:hypothetical protein
MKKMLSVELANKYQSMSALLTKCYFQSHTVVATTSCPVTNKRKLYKKHT